MILILCAISVSASAQVPAQSASVEPRQRAEPRLEGLLLTRVPDVMGAGAVLEGPGRIRLGASGGWIPQRYADVVNDLARDLEVWDATTAYVVDQLLPGSTTLRAELGWRPVPWRDLTVAAGYQ